MGELVLFEDMRGELSEELRRHETKTDADLLEEAEEGLASTEKWLEAQREPRPPGESGDRQRPAAPEGYSASLEKIVLEPMRRNAADGKLLETARRTNAKRSAEIREALSDIDRRLSTHPLRQAAADKPAVLSTVTPETLQGLSSSLVEDIPLDDLQGRRRRQ